VSLDIRVLGQEDLRSAARALRRAARTDLHKEMLAALRKATKPIGEEVRKSVPQFMPSGYAPVLAKALRFTTATKTSGWPEITVTAKAKGKAEPRRVEALNRGTLRAPLFGNRSRWYAHKITPGFFDVPARRVLNDVRREAAEAVHRVKEQLEREI
jgi:hypothetical protein